MGATPVPAPGAYDPDPYVVQWNDRANPRHDFPLVSGPPQVSGLSVSAGQARPRVGGLLVGHSAVEPSAQDLAAGNWSGLFSLVAGQPSQSLTNPISSSSYQLWRIFAP